MKQKMKIIFNRITIKWVPKSILFLGIFSLVLYLIFRLFFWIDTKHERKLVSQVSQIQRLTSEQLQNIQEGDIILRRGYGFFSDIIAKRLNDSVFDVTHAGILYKKKQQWYVIHSLSSDVSDFDGMQEQSLSEFLLYSVPEKNLVVRPKKISVHQGEQIVQKALDYLEQKCPFDHLGTIDEPSQMYCTELIWQILDTDLGLISLPKTYQERKKIFYSMKGLYDPQYFDIIVNTYPSDN